MLPDLALGQTWKSRVALVRAALTQTRMAMSISDPHREDSPLVAVNKAFLSLTGYDEDEVLGHNCRFLQGPGTDREEIRRLAEAITQRRSIYVEILNYRRDGRPFWNALYVGPVFDEAGALTYFFGSQWDISEKIEAREILTGRAEMSGGVSGADPEEVQRLREQLAAAEARREAEERRAAGIEADRDAWRDQAQQLAARRDEAAATRDVSPA